MDKNSRKNSKLKEVTENSSSNPKKVGTFLCKFWRFLLKIERLRSKTSENLSKLRKKLNTQGKNKKSRHF